MCASSLNLSSLRICGFKEKMIKPLALLAMKALLMPINQNLTFKALNGVCILLFKKHSCYIGV